MSVHVYVSTSLTPQEIDVAQGGSGKPGGIGQKLSRFLSPRVRIVDDALGQLSVIAPWGDPKDHRWVLYLIAFLIFIMVVLWVKAVLF